MKERKWSKFWAVAVSVALTVTMLPEITPKTVSAAVEDSDYAATPVEAREITSGAAEEERTWEIAWSDEFNGTSLDQSKWSYLIGTGAEYAGDGWGNNELEYYTNGENAKVSDGILKITARKLTDSEKPLYGGKSYTSTRLWTMDDSSNPGGEKTTKFAKTYGRIEARIKIGSDATDGNSTGLWPAFWMMPSEDVYGTWAASGEVDIMEIRGRTPNVMEGNLHFGSQWPNNKSSGGAYNPANEAIDYDENFTVMEYHTYALEWLPGEMRWYMDDQLYHTTSNWYSTAANNATDFTYPAPFDENFYLLLNLAVGGNFDGGQLSQSWNNAWMDVDYVRVYDLVDSATGEIADYALMEGQVVKPVDEADDHLVSGEINVTNFADSALSEIKTTSNYPSEPVKAWYLSTMLNGAAAKSVTDEALKVDVTAGGDQNYSVQLIHNVPLTKGYRYVLTFDAKADASKSLAAKYGNIGGYPAYSDTYTVDLTPDWKSYTYVFDMATKTDATGRIEFNLGQTTGACYFKNFSVICTGLTPTMEEDAAKSPLGNGNHVYNGTFDQGKNRYYFWHASDATMSVEKQTRELKVVGSTEESKVLQKGMNLLSGDSYKVSLDAKSEANGVITVKLINEAGTIIYAEETIAIDNSYKSQPYTFDFAIETGVTDSEAVFEIVTGNNIVYLDNVSMIRTSNNNMDWSKVDFWPLYNGDFFNGADGWNIWSENAGYQEHNVTNGVLNVHSVIGANPTFYCVGVQSSSMSFVGGVPYKFTVHLNGSKDKTIKIETPDGVQKDYEFKADGNTVSIEYKPSGDKTGKLSMYFGIGEGAYDFSIDSIDVEVDGSKIEIPEGHAKPAGVASVGNVKEGTPVVIKYNDEDWASKLTTTYVNGTAINSNDVTVNGNSTLTIASNALPVAGNYSIKFDAAGYATTKAITQIILEASGNLITNGTFETNLDGWTSWFADWNVVNGTAAAENGKAAINIVSTEKNNWDSQFKQSNIEVAASEYYILQFDAFASINRPIQLEFGSLGTPSQTIVNLTNETDTYYITFRGVAASKAASILFMMGNVNGCLEDFPNVGPHSIYFDNVKLYAATSEQVEAIQTPTITLSHAVILGSDIVLNYTENSVWEKKPMTVTMNSENVNSFVVMNKAENTITIDKNAVAQAGTYNFTIKADGYKAINIPVKVLGSASENLFTGEWFTWIGDGDQGSVNCNDNNFTVDFVATITSQWGGPEFWSMQAKKSGISTFAGKEYKLSFDAELIYDDPSVTDNRGLVVEMSAQPAQQTLTIKPGMDSYEIIVSPGAKSDFYVLFLAGGAEFDVKPHTLNITNIQFREVVKEPVLIELDTPQNVNAILQEETSSVELTWDEVVNAVKYNVYRSEGVNGIFTFLGATETNSYTDNGLAAGTYSYQIKAIAETGSQLYKDSAFSNVTAGTTIEGEEIVATLENVTATNGTINILLDKVPTTAPVLADFALTLAVNGGNADILSASNFSWNEASRMAVVNFIALEQMSLEQNVIVSVTYQGTTMSAGSFKIDAAAPEVIKVTSITVNSNSSSVEKGKSLQMNATVLPSNATNALAVWSVENGTGAATISTSGLLTATQVGTVTVKAAAQDGSGVAGTKVITVYNVPVNPGNPTPTPATTPTPTPTEKGKIEMELSLEDINKEDNSIDLLVSLEELKKALTDKEVSKITIAVTLPEATSGSTDKTPSVTLNLEVLQAIKESGKDLVISINDKEGRTEFSWTFDAKLLASTKQKLNDVNISLERIAVKDAEFLKEIISKGSLGEGVVVHLNHEGLLPAQAGVKVYVGDLVKTTGTTKVYLYSYNKETGKLETLPFNTKYVVDAEGYITLKVLYGSDYVILLDSAEAKYTTSLVKQIKAAPAMTTLSLTTSKKKSTQIKLELPLSLEIVKKITDPASQSAMGRATVTYSSSDKSVATVDKNGKITAVGKGTTVITTTITLYSGKKKIIKTEIKVE